MNAKKFPYYFLCAIVLFFGILIWLDARPVYTQADEAQLFQVTQEYVRSADSRPHDFVTLNGRVYFAAEGTSAGLWQTDGTTAGTMLVKAFTEPLNGPIRHTDSLLYFTVWDEFDNEHLWRSDGTSAGTVLLSTLPGLSIYHAAVLGDKLFFRASDPAHGTELWQTDGTPEGTGLFLDLVPGPESGSPYYIQADATSLYFFSAGPTGSTLWYSDGTVAGTQSTMAPQPGPLLYSPEPVVMHDVFYFPAEDEAYGLELWRYAPTDGAPGLLRDIYPGGNSSTPGGFQVVDDTLFFVANDGVNGDELWRSDGTTAGTVLVRDLAPASSSFSPSNLTAVGSTLYFTASSGEEWRKELWQSDGTAGGTVVIKPAIDTLTEYDYNRLTAVAGELFFLIRGRTAESEERLDTLWKSDGTAMGTVPVQEVQEPWNFTAIGEQLYFSADSEAYGVEPWVSDGTPEGTVLVHDVNAAYIAPQYDFLTRVDNALYFISSDSTSSDPRVEARLWRSDGFAARAESVNESIQPSALYSHGDGDGNGNALYIAGVDETGPGLWKRSDSTGETELIERFAHAEPSNFVAFNDLFLFRASDELETDDPDVPVYAIWRSDGTPEGTFKLLEETPDAPSLALYTMYNDKIYAPFDGQIWVFDGTAEGTTFFTPMEFQYPIIDLWSTSESIFFVTTRSVSFIQQAQSLWRSDGSSEGTEWLELWYTSLRHLATVDDAFFFSAGTYSSKGDFETDDYLRYYNRNCDGVVTLTTDPDVAWQNDYDLVNEELYFINDDGVHGPEIWKSNGGEAGTSLVKDITPPALTDVLDAYPGPLFAFGERLFFGAHDGTHGKEPWQSDGTAAGTSLLADINGSPASSTPQEFFAHGSYFYFTADDEEHGRELWQSQGTSATTALVADLFPGPSGSHVLPQLYIDNTFYFIADNGTDGQQIYGLYQPGANPASASEPLSIEGTTALAPYAQYLPFVPACPQ